MYRGIGGRVVSVADVLNFFYSTVSTRVVCKPTDEITEQFIHATCCCFYKWEVYTRARGELSRKIFDVADLV
jgi:hypothetical protein